MGNQEEKTELSEIEFINEHLLQMIRKMQQLRNVNNQEGFIAVIQHALSEYFKNCDSYTLKDEKVFWQYYLEEVYKFNKQRQTEEPKTVITVEKIK